MNKYGHMAIRHWEKTDPDRFQQIPESDREPFFTELGEQADQWVADADARRGGHPDRCDRGPRAVRGQVGAGDRGGPRHQAEPGLTPLRSVTASSASPSETGR